MFVGMRPTSQKTSLDKWHKFTSITDTTFSIPRLLDTSSTLTWTSTGTAPAAGDVPVTASGTTATAVAQVATKTIDRVTISAHGIPIYNDIPADFFNCYTPFTYGGVNINSPEDEGALMIPFNLYPGTYQPSGHVNISRAREFYFKYTSSVINSSTTGELVIAASAINFLLISDGSAVLRYST